MKLRRGGGGAVKLNDDYASLYRQYYVNRILMIMVLC